MSSKLGEIWLWTTELAALERFSYLQAMRTFIKAWMSSKFGQIRPLVSMATDTVII